jgi:hypothetical protein
VDGLCAKLVFATSRSWAGGDLGGVAGADAKCQETAAGAGLPGTFKAWISDEGGDSPSTRFTRSVAPYALVNGAVVVKNWSALVGVDAAVPASSLGHTISLDEWGRPLIITANAWTGTEPSGASIPLRRNCDDTFGDWASTGGQGGYGSVSSVDADWTSAGTLFCNQLARLYCFEQ